MLLHEIADGTADIADGSVDWIESAAVIQSNRSLLSAIIASIQSTTTTTIAIIANSTPRFRICLISMQIQLS